jgi:hypothetical protein
MGINYGNANGDDFGNNSANTTTGDQGNATPPVPGPLSGHSNPNDPLFAPQGAQGGFNGYGDASDWNTASGYSYLGMPDQYDSQGRIIPGSSGAAQEVGRLQGIAGDYRNQAAPTIDYANANADRNAGVADWQANYQQAQGARGNQSDSLGLLAGAARGNAPSAAQIQQQQGIDAAVRSQQALAASARGPGALAAAQGQAAGNTAMLQQQGIAQNSALRAQEMAQARGQYSEASNAMRGQDLSQMQMMRAAQLQQQGLDAQQAAAQASVEMQQRELGLQGSLGYEGLAANVGQNAVANYNNYRGFLQGQWGAQAALNQSSNQMANSNYQAAAGGIGGALGIGNTGSDVRMKTDVHKEDAGKNPYDSSQGLNQITSDREAKERARAEGRAEGEARALGYVMRDAKRAPDGGVVESFAPARPVAEAQRDARTADRLVPMSYAHTGRAYPGGGAQVDSYRFQPAPAVPSPPPAAAVAQAPAPAPAPTWSDRARSFASGLAHGATAGIISDEDMKEPHGHLGTKNTADALLEQLKPYSYRYKRPADEPSSAPTGGRYLGVMAQDIEKVPEIGRQIVKDTPRGKVLEGGALSSALAGGLGRLHQRVRKLEGMR